MTLNRVAVAAAALLLSAAPAAAENTPAEVRAGVVDAVTAIAAGADRRDWPRVRAAFADTVTTDYTSLFGGEPVTQPADALVAGWAAFLPGFDATQHLVANHTITAYDGASAEAQADFQATHRIADRFWVLGGRYDYALTKTGGRWVVSKLTMTAIWETGDRALTAEAGKRSE